MSNIIIVNDIPTIWGSAHHGSLLLIPACSDYKTKIINNTKHVWYKRCDEEWIIIKNLDFEINTFRERLVQILIMERDKIRYPDTNIRHFDSYVEGYHSRMHQYAKYIEHVYNRPFIKSVCKELQHLICES
jgi:hypothetical protein